MIHFTILAGKIAIYALPCSMESHKVSRPKFMKNAMMAQAMRTRGRLTFLFLKKIPKTIPVRKAERVNPKKKLPLGHSIIPSTSPMA